MDATTTTMRISPKLVVADMGETVAFYQDVLGFTAIRRTPEHAILERDG